MIEASRLMLNGIPCHLFRETRYSSCPLLLHYHAWGDHKGNLLNPDLTLIQAASQGFAVIAPDCPEHGERQTPDQFKKTMNGWAFLCQVMEQARQESIKLMDAILRLKYVAPEYAVVSGISMGALIAQMVFANDKRLGGLISVVGRSSFLQHDRWCDTAQKGTWAQKWCVQNATPNQISKLVDRPVLFLDGGKDTLCPPMINEKTVRLINRAGGQARQIVDRKSGHGFSQPLRQSFIDWLCLYGGLPSYLERKPAASTKQSTHGVSRKSTTKRNR